MSEIEQIYASARAEFLTNLNSFYYTGKQRPWHYLFLRDFKWYRKLTKGLWCRFEIEPNYFFWDRMNVLFKYAPVDKIEDYRK